MSKLLAREIAKRFSAKCSYKNISIDDAYIVEVRSIADDILDYCDKLVISEES